MKKGDTRERKGDIQDVCLRKWQLEKLEVLILSDKHCRQREQQREGTAKRVTQ